MAINPALVIDMPTIAADSAGIRGAFIIFIGFWGRDFSFFWAAGWQETKMK